MKAIQCIGCYLLYYGTSNLELSSILLLYGLSKEHLDYFWYRTQLAYEASTQKSSAVMMGRPLYTMEELNQLSSETTKIELEKLRQKMIQDPVLTTDLKTKLRLAQKNEIAAKISQFINGAYHLASAPMYGPESKDDAIKDGSSSKSANGGTSKQWFLRIGQALSCIIVIVLLFLEFQKRQKVEIHKSVFEKTAENLPKIMNSLSEFTMNTLAMAAEPIKNAIRD